MLSINDNVEDITVVEFRLTGEVKNTRTLKKHPSRARYKMSHNVVYNVLHSCASQSFISIYIAEAVSEGLKHNGKTTGGVVR
jgi:hypothetical protein